MTRPLVAPSLLSADFANLAAEVAALEAAGADWLHFDVMDGHFVKNITFGPPLIKSLRPLSKIFFDVHLMIENYHHYLAPFAVAGSDQITIHWEAPADAPLSDALTTIKKLGKKCGLAIKPATTVAAVAEVVAQVDVLIIMGVEPGFGGQKFIETAYDKITAASRLVAGTQTIVEIDGGVDATTAPAIKRAFAAGGAPANQLSLVAGNYIMGDGMADQYGRRIATLHQ